MKRAGFTMIELIIVTVVIASLGVASLRQVQFSKVKTDYFREATSLEKLLKDLQREELAVGRQLGVKFNIEDKENQNLTVYDLNSFRLSEDALGSASVIEEIEFPNSKLGITKFMYANLDGEVSTVAETDFMLVFDKTKCSVFSSRRNNNNNRLQNAQPGGAARFAPNPAAPQNDFLEAQGVFFVIPLGLKDDSEEWKELRQLAFSSQFCNLEIVFTNELAEYE